MFDTHCHLNSEEFNSSFSEVIKSAREVDLKYFLIPGYSFESSKKAIEIAESFVGVYASVGIHPTENLEELDIFDTLIKLEELAKNKKVKAVGEIGLDYYRFQSPPKVQKKFLEEQLKLAVKLDLSAIIHNRAADNDILEVIEKCWSQHFERRLVLHCVTASKQILKYAKERHLLVGIDGDVTYDDKKQKFIAQVPLENLVLETDSPYLVPEPMRSQHIFPNEPKNLEVIAQKVSQIKNIKYNDIISTTTKNGKELFAI